MSRYVRIYYGPYEEFFTYSHKPQKIKGLKDALLKHGYRVHLIAVDYVNCCIIEVNGVEVFRCNIRNLCLNVPPEDDVVCQRALAAVHDASGRLRRANSHFWMHTVFKQILYRSEYSPRATWPFDVDIKPLTPIEDCINCCRILVTKKRNRVLESIIDSIVGEEKVEEGEKVEGEERVEEEEVEKVEAESAGDAKVEEADERVTTDNVHTEDTKVDDNKSEQEKFEKAKMEEGKPEENIEVAKEVANVPVDVNNTKLEETAVVNAIVKDMVFAEAPEIETISMKNV